MVSHIRLFILSVCVIAFIAPIAKSKNGSVNIDQDDVFNDSQSQELSTSVQIGKMLEINLENHDTEIINY